MSVERDSTSPVADGEARILLLGPVDLRLGEASLPLSGRKQRAVLAMLALAGGQVVSTAALIEGVWGDDPPPSVGNALQVCVSGLRKSLTHADLPSALVTQAPGYRLLLPEGVLDVDVFLSERRSADAAVAAGRRDDAVESYLRALGEWRGSALADLVDQPFAETEVHRLEEARQSTSVSYLHNEVALGRAAASVAQVESLVRSAPLQEDLWALLSLAYYRSARQADALAALRRARRMLDEELGIEPGAELRELERRMLAQDPSLDPSTRPASASGPSFVTHLRSELPATSASLVDPSGRRVRLDRGVVTIGRRIGNDVVVEHADVSRRHAEVLRVAGGWALQDLGSTNGTYVNGDLVVRAGLSHGDRIELGPMILRYEVDEVSERAT